MNGAWSEALRSRTIKILKVKCIIKKFYSSHQIFVFFPKTASFVVEVDQGEKEQYELTRCHFNSWKKVEGVNGEGSHNWFIVVSEQRICHLKITDSLFSTLIIQFVRIFGQRVRGVFLVLRLVPYTGPPIPTNHSFVTCQRLKNSICRKGICCLVKWKYMNLCRSPLLQRSANLLLPIMTLWPSFSFLQFGQEIAVHIQQRLHYQWKVIHRFAKTSLPLSHKTSRDFVHICNTYGVDVPSHVSRRLCPWCSVIQLPTITCSTKLQKRTRKSQSNVQQQRKIKNEVVNRLCCDDAKSYSTCYHCSLKFLYSALWSAGVSVLEL